MKHLLALLAAAGIMSVMAEMERATPESQGVPSEAIMRLLDAFGEAYGEYPDQPGRPKGGPHGIVIVRHGKVIAEGSWKPFDTLNETHMLYSHSKTFTATAIGFLAEEGKLDLDERVVDIFDAETPTNACENLRMLRVRDLLTMNCGGKKAHSIEDGGDWVRNFLTSEFPKAPGCEFRYDSDATYMLAVIVERRSGEKLMDYLGRRLFSRIGIEKAWTTTSPQGIACGGWGMNMTTREIARFGQFLLQRGRWNGEYLINPLWIDLMTARHTVSGWKNVGIKALGEGSDWEQGYGFQCWRCTQGGAYRCDGSAGQYTLVFPEADMVVSIHAGSNQGQLTLDLVYRHLLSAVRGEPLAENQEACAALERRLATLAIAPMRGTFEGVERFLDVDYEFADPHDRGFKSVRLAKNAEGGVVLKFRTRGGESEVRLGSGEWTPGVMTIDPERYEWLGALIGRLAVKSSAGMRQPGEFVARIYFTGGTHYLDFTFCEENGRRVVHLRMFGMSGRKFEGVECAGASAAR